MQHPPYGNKRRKNKSQSKNRAGAKMNLKPDDLVLCTVRNIEGTAVFVDIGGNGTGSIVMSEIAAGRIRKIKEYVYSNKKIVCKVLKVHNGNIELTLRRVTAKERDEVLEENKREKILLSILKIVSKTPEKILEKIKESYSALNFLEQVRETPRILDSLFDEKEAKEFLKIVSEKKEKEKFVKKTIVIKSFSPSGIKDIKDILSSKEADIRYLGSSQFSVSATAKDFKEANSSLNSILDKIEKKAKEKKVFLEIKEK